MHVADATTTNHSLRLRRQTKPHRLPLPDRTTHPTIHLHPPTSQTSTETTTPATPTISDVDMVANPPNNPSFAGHALPLGVTDHPCLDTSRHRRGGDPCGRQGVVCERLPPLSRTQSEDTFVSEGSPAPIAGSNQRKSIIMPRAAVRTSTLPICRHRLFRFATSIIAVCDSKYSFHNSGRSLPQIQNSPFQVTIPSQTIFVRTTAIHQNWNTGPDDRPAIV